MKIKHFINNEFLTVKPYTGLNAVKDSLLKQSAIVVHDEEQFYGVLTIKDIANSPKTLVIDCLSTKPLIDSDYTVEQTLKLMSDIDTDVLPVGDIGNISGLVFKNVLNQYLIEHNILLEDAVKKRTEDLEKAILIKDLILSIIGHDLKSPLATAKGFSEIIEDRFKEGNLDKIKKYTGMIHSNIIKVDKLLDSLLELAESQMNYKCFSPNFFNLSDLCDEVIDFVEDIAEIKNIKLTGLPASSIEVFADKNMVQTVLRNFVSNAIKYSHKNSEVIISAKENDKFIEITVSDDGVGLDNVDIDSLFESDINPSLPGTVNEKGHGLGLLICRNLVENNGGEIWAINKPEGGAEFTFTLPMHKEEVN